MPLSELLGSTVRDARLRGVGTVVDVGLAASGDLDDSPSAPTVFGLVRGGMRTQFAISFCTSRLRVRHK